MLFSPILLLSPGGPVSAQKGVLRPEEHTLHSRQRERGFAGYPDLAAGQGAAHTGGRYSHTLLRSGSRTKAILSHEMVTHAYFYFILFYFFKRILYLYNFLTALYMTVPD